MAAVNRLTDSESDGAKFSSGGHDNRRNTRGIDHLLLVRAGYQQNGNQPIQQAAAFAVYVSEFWKT